MTTFVYVEHYDGGSDVYDAAEWTRAALGCGGRFAAARTVSVVTPETVAEARGWTADVVGDPDSVDEGSDRDVLRFVQQHYDGGLGAFLLDVS